MADKNTDGLEPLVCQVIGALQSSGHGHTDQGFSVILYTLNGCIGGASDPGLSREENILRLMAKQGAVTRKDVEQLLGCSSFPANKALAALVEQGKIVKTGAARGTKYVLK